MGYANIFFSPGNTFFTAPIWASLKSETNADGCHSGLASRMRSIAFVMQAVDSAVSNAVATMKNPQLVFTATVRSGKSYTVVLYVQSIRQT